MYEPLRRFALNTLKVPHDPVAPAGDPGSLKVFRAGHNYLRLRLAGWVVAQVLALGGIVFWTVFLVVVERSLRESPPAPGAVAAQSAVPAPADGQAAPKRQDRRNAFERFVENAAKEAERASKAKPDAGRLERWYAGYKQFAVEVGRLLPDWAFIWIWVLKIAGIGFYFVQLPVTYAVRRLDYEMRWYLVTDRSLRLREGVWSVQETTMSFANVQEVVVTQGPLQRLLGLGDVQVKSAGGGASSHQHHNESADLHTGKFHCVTNAPEIRDLILERLRKFRDAGLGDPEDKHATHHEPAAVIATAPSGDVLAAAREAIAEAKALRSAVL